MTDLPFSPAAERNRQPILESLLHALPGRGQALEIASGTGQHACWFAAAMPRWTWQPTDADSAALPVIAEYRARSALPNIRPPLQLDVMASPWPTASDGFTKRFDAIYCANLIHIAQWQACTALMQGAARHLSSTGVLLTYGPYIEDGVPTSAGNAAFDGSLRTRDAAWGIRRLADVAAEAGRSGFRLRARHALPSNNLLLEWVRSGG